MSFWWCEMKQDECNVQAVVIKWPESLWLPQITGPHYSLLQAADQLNVRVSATRTRQYLSWSSVDAINSCRPGSPMNRSLFLFLSLSLSLSFFAPCAKWKYSHSVKGELDSSWTKRISVRVRVLCESLSLTRVNCFFWPIDCFTLPPENRQSEFLIRLSPRSYQLPVPLWCVPGGWNKELFLSFFLLCCCLLEAWFWLFWELGVLTSFNRSECVWERERKKFFSSSCSLFLVQSRARNKRKKKSSSSDTWSVWRSRLANAYQGICIPA